MSKAIKRRGLKNHEVATAVGRTPSLISKIRRGVERPSEELTLLLVKLLPEIDLYEMRPDIWPKPEPQADESPPAAAPASSVAA